MGDVHHLFGVDLRSPHLSNPREATRKELGLHLMLVDVDPAQGRGTKVETSQLRRQVALQLIACAHKGWLSFSEPGTVKEPGDKLAKDVRHAILR